MVNTTGEIVLDILTACGYTSIPKFAGKDNLLEMIAKYEVLDKPRSAIEQFKEGLSILGVLDLMKRYPAELETVFCFQGKVLSASLVASCRKQHARKTGIDYYILEGLFTANRR